MPKRPTPIDMRMRAVEDRDMVSLVERIADERARKDRRPQPSRARPASSGVAELTTAEPAGGPARLVQVRFSGTPTYYFSGDGASWSLLRLTSFGTRPVGKDVYAPNELTGLAGNLHILDPEGQ